MLEVSAVAAIVEVMCVVARGDDGRWGIIAIDTTNDRVLEAYVKGRKTGAGCENDLGG